MSGRDLLFTILGIDKGSPALNKVGAAADRASDRLDHLGKVSVSALGASVGAATAAGVGIAAALGGSALAFGALGVVAASSNQQVRDSYSDMWSGIVAATQQDAQVLVPTLLGISDQVGSTMVALRSDIAGLFADSIPALEHLTDGVTGLAREAMPGLRAAVGASEPAMAGIRDLMIDTGRGATDFFTAVSGGAESSGQIIRVFGAIVRDALGLSGTLLARLSNEGAPAVQRLGVVVDQLTDSVDSLSAGALPILFASAGIGLDVLSGLLSIVNGLAGALGPVAGVAISAGAALKLIDMVSFGAVTGQVGRLKAGMAEAHGMAGKLKAGMLGVGLGFGPLGLAAILLGGFLGELGQQQQKAAEKAAEHRQRVDGLTRALVESKNMVTDQIAQDQIREGQLAGLYDAANQMGIGYETMTKALLGNKDAIGEVNRAWDTQPPILDAIGGKANDLSNKFNVLGIGEREYTSGSRQRFGELSGAMLEAQDAAAGIAQKQREAAVGTQEHTAALSRLQEALLGFVNKDLAYRQAIDAEQDAHHRVEQAIKDHGKASEEASDATLAWEQSMVGAVARSGELADSQYQGSDASEKARLKVEAQNREIVRLAEASGDVAPTALRQMIASMDASSMAALGMTIRTDEAGAAVVRLPSGKEIRLTAADQATAKIAGVERSLNRIDGKVGTVVLRALTTGPGIGAIGSAVFRAAGGPVRKGQPTVVGEAGPELIFPNSDGYVVDALTTRRLMTGGSGGGALTSSGPAHVVIEFGRGRGRFEELLIEFLRDHITVRGGNVQAVLGR